MNAKSEIVEVVGAGPAGFAAAITLALAGRRVLVHEAQNEVGHRFGADLQGLENWSTKGDVLGVLRDAGITTAFEKLPCAHVTAFDARDGRHTLRSAQPLFYLVERGPGEGTLDSALLAQARALGVAVRFGSRMTRLEGPGILAVGPKAADAIAVGYHFETDMPDGVWLILDDAMRGAKSSASSARAIWFAGPKRAPNGGRPGGSPSWPIGGDPHDRQRLLPLPEAGR